MGFSVIDVPKIKGFNKYCEGDGGTNIFHLYPDLSVWKCGSDKNVNIDKTGKLDDNGYLVLNHENIIKYQESNPFNDEKCNKCKILPLCFGGCPINYHKYKKRFCPDYKSLYDLLR